MKTVLWSLFGSLTSFSLAVADDFPKIYNSERDATLAPMDASEAARTMVLPPGFQASVVASEPEVQNPIAMNWDEQGRLWIAENYTYAERSQRFDLSLRDRVLVFEDSNGDGQLDKRTVFTDQLQMLTGIEVGRGGVWLMCPPRLLFIPDTDQNLVPDDKAQTILDGFEVAQDNYHNFANGLKWGPDGWLYGRCGHSCPGNIGVPGTPPDLRIPIDGGIWRFHPEKKIFETLCHGTTNPWGHDWDENGELFFINTVIGHLWHCIPGSHFKESFGESMNPLVYERMDMIADHYHFDTKGSWTDSRDGKANDFGGGHAHIGCMIYQSDVWPDEYRGKLFTLNMHGYRANVERLERAGSGYIGRHEPDFLFSKDPFFRAMEMNVGPDGQVYLIDWSDTGECHEHTGVHRESGRLFKIQYTAPDPSSDRSQSHTSHPRVHKPACLAGNGPLQQMWAAYREGTLSKEALLDALRDPNPHLRVWSIRLLTDYWPLDTIIGPRADAIYPDDPDTYQLLLETASSEMDGLVLTTLASVLQRLPLEKRAALAERLLSHSVLAQDRDFPFRIWFGLMPTLQSTPEQMIDLIANASRQGNWHSLTQWTTRAVVGMSQERPQLLETLLTRFASAPSDVQESVLRGLVDGYRGERKANRPTAWDAFLKSDLRKNSSEHLQRLDALFGGGQPIEEIRALVLDAKADMKMRVAALETLIDSKTEDLRQVCERVIETRVLNRTALRGLALFDELAVGQLIAKSYRRFQPVDRPAVLETLLSRGSFAKALVDSLEKPNSPIPAHDILPIHARQIKSLGNADLQARFARAWGELRETPAEKLEQKQQLTNALSGVALAQADLAAGRILFNKQCAKCHRLYGEGETIGPDLTGSQRASLEYLLENILDPSAVVAKDYRMTIVQTEDGRTMSGLIVTQDNNRVELQTQNNREVFLKSEIAEMKTTQLSAMPDGIFDAMRFEEIRDLIGYLMHPTQVPLPQRSLE